MDMLAHATKVSWHVYMCVIGVCFPSVSMTIRLHLGIIVVLVLFSILFVFGKPMKID